MTNPKELFGSPRIWSSGDFAIYSFGNSGFIVAHKGQMFLDASCISDNVIIGVERTFRILEGDKTDNFKIVKLPAGKHDQEFRVDAQ